MFRELNTGDFKRLLLVVTVLKLLVCVFTGQGPAETEGRLPWAFVTPPPASLCPSCPRLLGPLVYCACFLGYFLVSLVSMQGALDISCVVWCVFYRSEELCGTKTSSSEFLLRKVLFLLLLQPRSETLLYFSVVTWIVSGKSGWGQFEYFQRKYTLKPTC